MTGTREALKSKLGISNKLSQVKNDSLGLSWCALKLALTVFEKTLDGVPNPGLKGAVGGFLELAKKEEVSVVTIAPRCFKLKLSRHQSRMQMTSLSFKHRSRN
jgi:hypothetical protein